MPGFDRTGPEGKGSQTGRKRGKCNPENRNGKLEADETRLGLRQGKHQGAGAGHGHGKRRSSQHN